ncbi:protocadherin-11 X-linked [Alligator mississippiensis]|uniref:Protocadherin-11 X-linked n=1 Tax=Alligator mississippiensis TaxID=8496 RepID=A0A151NNY3_ALLMI|nr:protocadherin-11 X-linked [Alligator mississippiensis]
MPWITILDEMLVNGLCDRIHIEKNRGQTVSQRRVTFHLPDGSQESCNDSGLGDHEPNSNASTSHPLPLGFPQEEYYEQASPNSRTEGDGNSDPESNFILRGLFQSL